MGTGQLDGNRRGLADRPGVFRDRQSGNLRRFVALREIQEISRLATSARVHPSLMASIPKEI